MGRVLVVVQRWRGESVGGLDNSRKYVENKRKCIACMLGGCSQVLENDVTSVENEPIATLRRCLWSFVEVNIPVDNGVGPRVFASWNV